MVNILGEREQLQYYQTLEEAERAFDQLSNKGHDIILMDLSTGKILKSEFDNPEHK